jgi:prepilin signal peptidase PulO-like enzyme (type II secretory pathway)
MTIMQRRLSLPFLSTSAALIALATMAAVVAVLLVRQPALYESLLILSYGAVFTTISAHDADTHLAPNRIVYPSFIGLVLLTLPLGAGDFAFALAGAALAFVLLMVVAIAGRGAMGFGDVKYGTVCGLALGLSGVLPMLMLAFIGGGVLALLVLVARVRRRKDVVAFTPFLTFATLGAMLLVPGYLTI